MTRTTVNIEPAFRIFSTTQMAPLGGVSAYSGDVHYPNREAAQMALAALVAADCADLIAAGCDVPAGAYDEETGFLAYGYGPSEPQAHYYRSYEVRPAYDGVLYNADEACEHLVEDLLSGRVCVRCHGTAKPPRG